MLICRACGKPNRTDAHFCQGCGADLNARICAGCGQLNSSQARACSRCGKVLVKVCVQCQRANKPQARFCQFCGGGLNACPHCGATNRPGARFCQQCGRDPTNLGVQPLLDAVLKQRYKILHLIARGGMGAVYQVADLHQPGQVWALKEMSLDNVEAHEQQDAIADFRREAQLLRVLSHPNLVKVVDSFSEQGKEYLVMEYVRGEILDAFLQNKPRTEATVLPLAFQLCDVLGYLHTQKPPIIYRDLKPGNAMIETDSGNLKLIDFGIARFYKPGQKKDTKLLGTPGFAPPEQYGQGQTDARSDIFTLGVTLHVLLTDFDVEQNPWNYPPVTSLNHLISKQMEQVIGKATEMESYKRYQSMAEMRQALLGCPGGKALTKRSDGAKISAIKAPPPVMVKQGAPGPGVAPPLAANAAQGGLAWHPPVLTLQVEQNATAEEALTIQRSGLAAHRIDLTASPAWLAVTPQQLTGASETIKVSVHPPQVALPRIHRPVPNWLAQAWAWAESKGAQRQPGSDVQAWQCTLLFGLPALLFGSLAYALAWAVYQHAYFFVPGVGSEQGRIEVNYPGGMQTIPVALTIEPAKPRLFLGWSAAISAVIGELFILWLLL